MPEEDLPFIVLFCTWHVLNLQSAAGRDEVKIKTFPEALRMGAPFVLYENKKMVYFRHKGYESNLFSRNVIPWTGGAALL